MPDRTTRVLAAVLFVVFGTIPPAMADPLVAFRVTDGGIAQPLTAQPGDPVHGRALVADPDHGGCLSCHAAPMPEEDFQGQVGPNLAGVGDRLGPAQLRLRLIDPKRINPTTVMPAFYRTEGLHRVAKAFEGKPILTAQEIEDVVAYLVSLH